MDILEHGRRQVGHLAKELSPTRAGAELFWTPRAFWALFKQSCVNWSNHRVPRMAAALAFYAAVSLPPLATLTLSLLSYAVRRDVARKQILEAFHFLFGSRGGSVLDPILAHSALHRAGAWQAIVSSFILLLAATQIFGELQNSLDQIWGIRRDKTPFRTFFRHRLLSMAMVLTCGLVFLISLHFSSLTKETSYFMQRLGLPLEIIHWALLFLAANLLFTVLFWILPPVTLRISDVYLGASLTAALFVVGRWGLGIYLDKSPLSLTYGTLTSFLIVLLCVFYLAQIFYFGAEFTCCYAKNVGSHRSPITRETSAPLVGKET